MGLKIPLEHDKPYWTNNFITWLKALAIADSGNKLTTRCEDSTSALPLQRIL